MMLQNDACIKEPFKVHDRPKCMTDFNVTEYEKFTDVVSDATLQQTFKKLLVKFWSSFKDYSQLIEKAIRIVLPFPTIYLCKAFSNYISGKGFSHIVQPTQHIATEWMQKHLWDPSCFLLGQTLKRSRIK